MDYFKQLITDIKVSLDDAFDHNFETRSFFGAPWKQTAMSNHKGSLMQRSGKLRRSLHSNQRSYGISYTSTVPYAQIQNEGGTITITRQMQRFFWAMYYRSAGAMTYSIKTRQMNNTAKNRRLSEESEYWKSLALKKVGEQLKIPQRQFIGHHPQVNQIVKRCADRRMNEFADHLNKNFRKLT